MMMMTTESQFENVWSDECCMRTLTESTWHASRTSTAINNVITNQQT